MRGVATATVFAREGARTMRVGVMTNMVDVVAIGNRADE
jgi:hypothetical protein